MSFRQTDNELQIFLYEHGFMDANDNLTDIAGILGYKWCDKCNKWREEKYSECSCQSINKTNYAYYCESCDEEFVSEYDINAPGVKDHICKNGCSNLYLISIGTITKVPESDYSIDCPICEESSFVSKWDKETVIRFGGQITSIHFGWGRKDYNYICPNCIEEIDGAEIK